jgi:DNA primase
VRWDLATSEGKASAAQELYPLIATMENAFEQERYFQKLADTLKVPRNTLEASLGKPRPNSRASRRTDTATAQISASAFENERHNPLEEHLLALLLQWPELKDQVGALTPDMLERWENRELFTRWLNCSTIEGLRKDIEDDLQPQLDRLLTLSFPPLDLHQREQAVKDCSNRLEERSLRNMKAEESLLLDQDEQPEARETLEQRVVDTNERLRLLFEQRSQQQNG